jgi:hypothetical protein
MVVSDAGYYISNEKKKNESSQMGHTKFFFNESSIFILKGPSTLDPGLEHFA